MADVVIVGDGPAGISAAILLAKNGQNVTLIGKDETPAHKALIFNYLGIEKITGTQLLEVGRRQAAAFGAELVSGEVTGISRNGAGYAVTTADGAGHKGKYLLLATGTARDLAAGVGAAVNEDDTVQVDLNGRTSLPNLYAAGWSVRRHKIEAIISAGDGAAVALDILSAEAGKDVHDFDVVEGA